MSTAVADSKFGQSARGDFLFANDYLNLNHGSFGTYPRVVRDQLRQFQDAVEQRPDEFIRYDYPNILDHSREAVAKLLNADVGEIVFVPNATTGVNTVLRNLTFHPGDVIIYFATIYGACEKTVSFITETTPAEDFKISYTYPVTNATLVSKLEEAIKTLRTQGKNPRIAIFDTVVSLPGVRFPYEQLTEVCRKEGVLSCIDGAHAIGMLRLKDLDLGRLQPDFFVSNCHKWLYAPRGCAVFYVAKRNQHLMRSTLPTSHGFVALPRPGVPPVMNPLPTILKTPFVANFEFVGTIDNAPYLCVPTAIKYRQDRYGGEDAIAEYLWKLARKAGQIVAKALDTDVLENGDDTLHNCPFTNIRLPIDPRAIAREAGRQNEVDLVANQVLNWIVQSLMQDHGTFIPVTYYANSWWVRLSAQVYLEEADFVKAAEMLKSICQRVEKGEFLNKGGNSKL